MAAPQPQGISIRDDQANGNIWTSATGGTVSYSTPSVFATKILVDTNGTSITMRLNDATVETATSGDTTSITVNKILIGGVDGWSDLIGSSYEILIYDRILDSGEISAVESY